MFAAAFGPSGARCLQFSAAFPPVALNGRLRTAAFDSALLFFIVVHPFQGVFKMTKEGTFTMISRVVVVRHLEGLLCAVGPMVSLF